MTFIFFRYNRRWPALRESYVPAPVGSRSIYGYYCFNRTSHHLHDKWSLYFMSFAWISDRDGDFEAGFEAQASAFSQLAILHDSVTPF